MRIGILGGGQLARMMALAAYPLNVRTRVYEPADESCAAQVTERVRGEYDDYRTLYQFIRGCDAVTYEFENVPLETAHWINERVPVYPPPEALRISQDRVVEKTFLRGLGIRVPDFRAVDSRDDFDAAVGAIGLPCVLKTTRFGYDGKGQMVIRMAEEAERAWELLGGRPLILEQFVAFDYEISVILVRTPADCQTYAIIRNAHREGILRQSYPLFSAGMDGSHRAPTAARLIADALAYRGVLAVEFFVKGDDLYVNEMAPRVHNSGHWTLDGAYCSQFENHLRAVGGLPIQTAATSRNFTMLNCIGRMPTAGDLPRSLDYLVRLHDYGKTAKPGRKLGHLNVSSIGRIEQCEAVESTINFLAHKGIEVG